jgi:hypothetical protein
LVGEARAGEAARLNIDGKDDDVQILKGGQEIMKKPNAKGRRADDGAELSPEEMEAAIALFKAQQAASQATGEGTDGEEDPEETPTEGQEEEKSPVDKVRENIDRRDSEGEGMDPEEIIAEQKADLDTLLEEIDKLQASSDMNGDEGEEDNPEGEGSPDSEEENSDEGEEESEEEKEKGVNMDSVDRIIQDRLDVCRMADKLNLDGVEKLSVTEGRKRIIKAVNPKINLDGKSNSYINAAYDIAKQSFHERKSTDDQRQKMVTNKVRKDAKEESNSNSARKNMISRMTGGRK